MQLPFLSEKSGAIALAQPGLTTGWLAGRQSDEIVLNLEIFKIIYWIKYSSFCYVQQRYSVIIDVPIDFSRFFHVKPTLRWILDMPKFWTPFFWVNPYY